MIEELRSACATKTAPHVDRLNDGPSVSYVGKPAPAEPGTIALAQGDLSIIIAEKDIRRVDKAGEYYRVFLNGDANVLFRLQKVDKASGSCGCDGKARQDKTTRREGWNWPPHFPFEVCEVRIICFHLVDHDVCFGILVCDGGPFG